MSIPSSIPPLLYALTILHAGYIIQLSFRQPSSKKITTPSEGWLMWFLASSAVTSCGRAFALILAAHHATVALAQSGVLADSVLQSTCPVPEHLDAKLFTWSYDTMGALAVLYLGSYIRFQAYAQLGANFTYRIAKPDQLVTSGLYAYVRHPSYTGIMVVLGAMYALFFRTRGLVSCWAPEWASRDERLRYVVPVVVFGFVGWATLRKRVGEEERMMEREFGEKWREHCNRTKKFVPFVY